MWSRPAGPARLNAVVHDRCTQAGLDGNHSFTNLPDGWIRDALRGGVPIHEVAAHADLRSLSSVNRHERREKLLTDNVAGRLGL